MRISRDRLNIKNGMKEYIGYSHQKWLDGRDDCKRSLLHPNMQKLRSKRYQ